MHTEVVNVEEPVFGEARDRTFVTGGRCASGPVAVAHVLRVETGVVFAGSANPPRGFEENGFLVNLLLLTVFVLRCARLKSVFVPSCHLVKSRCVRVFFFAIFA